MTTRQEVMREFTRTWKHHDAREMLDSLYRMADRIRELECRAERAEQIINRIEGMAERAEWKGYDLNPSDVLGALNP